MKRVEGEAVSVAARPWRIYLLVVVLAYALLQTLYIRATPLQSITLPDNLPRTSAARPLLVGLGPDEKEHFLYLLSIAEGGALPVPTPAWRTSPREYVTYQAQHPPLFYAAGSTLYHLTPFLSETQFWYLLRAFCTLCGAGVILLASEAARSAFPDRPFVWWGTAPAIAFLPMFAHMTACVSNEPLAMLFGAWAWLQACRIARAADHAPTPRTMAILGLTLGLAALTRLTALLWLIPAAAVLLRSFVRTGAHEDTQRSSDGLKNVVACGLAFAAPLAPWLWHNHQTFGQWLVRPFSRPMLQSLTLGQYLGDPNQPLHIVSGGSAINVVVPPLTIFLWYASSAAVPFWLIQFYLPNFPQASAAWQAIFLLFDVAVLLLLFLHASAARRGDAPPDAAGRLLLWSAGTVVGVCALALAQQQLYSDWDVLYSAGRYLVAFVPAASLVTLFALSTKVKPGRGTTVAVGVVVALMFALDLYGARLVQQFYTDHPSQPSVQPITAATLTSTAIFSESGRRLG